MTRAERIACDRSLDSSDVFSLFKILLSGIAPAPGAVHVVVGHAVDSAGTATDSRTATTAVP